MVSIRRCARDMEAQLAKSAARNERNEEGGMDPSVPSLHIWNRCRTPLVLLLLLSPPFVSSCKLRRLFFSVFSVCR